MESFYAWLPADNEEPQLLGEDMFRVVAAAEGWVLDPSRSVRDFLSSIKRLGIDEGYIKPSSLNHSPSMSPCPARRTAAISVTSAVSEHPVDGESHDTANALDNTGLGRTENTGVVLDSSDKNDLDEDGSNNMAFEARQELRALPVDNRYGATEDSITAERPNRNSRLALTRVIREG
ncbi:unnamed protein product [Periconia digitata]|uniref:Uncharacterized protein n=1 Tax=Periconia digitata TaxID=1303443 RepID=A0A9W4U838_9PLEO|nr:unnamed protein product [Periconia digitata]